MRKIIIALLMIVSLISSPRADVLAKETITVTASPKVSVPVITPSPPYMYELPFSGILPDHPFYLLKVLRDNMLLYFTKDLQKLVGLQILMADKRLGMGKELINNQKENLGVTTISKGEKYLLRALESMQKMREKGENPDIGLINKVKTSTDMHQEVIKQLMDRSDGDTKSGLGLSYQIVQDVGQRIDVFRKEAIEQQ